ncbi:MAG: hypothetical protein SXA11_03795 [Cyanobacteriota bacterium]|nr:hypothetical protein [Cyanobacteriota bacterium]
MTQSLKPAKTIKMRSKKRQASLFEKIMAIVAMANLALVFFNMTYVPMRDLYFRYLPSLVAIYDPVKGIEPNRDTQKYLDTVEELKAELSPTSESPQEVSRLLEELREESVDMINENPFQTAGKSGVLERIKNRMRDKVPNSEDSAKEAFEIFWSKEYLEREGWIEEMNWFESQIKPLMEINYYRGIGESGELTDYFWKIDLPFIILFGLEFLARTFTISRRHVGVSWRDAMLWRWYDIFLLLPFWRWLRVIPVTVRLQHGNLLDLEPIRAQASRGFVASFARELTEVVLLQTIDKIQQDVNSGDLAKRLFSGEQREYIDLNNINEIEEIFSRLLRVVFVKVMPELRPEIEALLRYNIEGFIKESPAYKRLKPIPGFDNLADGLAEQLVTELSNLASFGPQNAYENIQKSMDDPVGTELSNKLVSHFGRTLGEEIKKEQTLAEFQSLISAFLEEVKVNYVMQISQDDVDRIIEQSRELHIKGQQSPEPLR